MKITQTSSRTVRIETGSGGFSVPYRIFWNGHDRDPESIVLEGNKVQAFFLFATIRDEITEDANGILISRSWSVMTPGALRISLETDFDAADGGPACLFPGVAARIEPAADPYSILGERTSLPCSILLFSEEAGVLIYSSLPGEKGDAASIGVRRIYGEDGPLLRVETRIPPLEKPSVPVGPKQEHVEHPEEAEIVSESGFVKNRALSVVFAPRESITLSGMRSAYRRLCPGAKNTSTPVILKEETWKAALRSCMETHLYSAGGTAGLRERAGKPLLSVSAGAALALLLRRVYPSDPDCAETSLQLADFCLKAQHPTGLFYETYDYEQGRWLGVAGKRARRGGMRLFGGTSGHGPLVPVDSSARTADLLLELSETLEGEGRPGRKYALAAERFVDFFFDARGKLVMPGALHLPGERAAAEEGLAGFELFFPLLRMARRAKRDKYAKAMEAMAAIFAGVEWDVSQPPSSRGGRDPDSKAALLCGRLAAAMHGSGCAEVDPRPFLSLLASWIRINRPPRQEAVDSLGGLGDSFRRARLLFAGAETAFVLMSLGAISADKGAAETAADLARLSLEFTGRAPCGTAFFRHVRWNADGRPDGPDAETLGPVDSRVLTREVGFAIRLKEGFFTRAGKDRRGTAKPGAVRARSSARSASSAPSRKPSAKP
jgi:hypothetical protein